ncbi:MAG: SUV3 C-terminal domain-containing protein [Sulfurimonas sp.]|jgi:ATP-dependent RNA helicase SUPV3L1/SUV3
MANKHKKNTKINQKIKKYFDNDPFDVGIERVSTETLSELCHYLGIYDIEHNKKVLLKTIRAFWSEADSDFRQEILNFFNANGIIYFSTTPKEPNTDRSEKIESILKELNVTPEEAALLFDAFMEVRSKKITVEKVESKLVHIRYEMKKEELQKRLDGVFDFNDILEFNASLKYTLYEQSFHKILTLNTKPYDSNYLNETPIETLVTQISADKEAIVAQKQKSIDAFLANIKNPHPYLNHEQIINAFRAAPPKSKLKYPTLKQEVLKEIIGQNREVLEIDPHAEEVLLKVQEQYTLPYSEIVISYILEVHIEINTLLENIWLAQELHLDEEIKNAKKEHEEHFRESLKSLVDECGSYATLLHFTEEQLYKKVYEFLVGLMSKSLTISSKIARKTIKTFMFSIHEQLIKKQRQALLARTIRDFKNLFPMARQMRRKLILHIGPTNSGKTYQAMQRLQNADTGYYLAPLRLLALEGYETLKENGIESSLITGEEQLLNEDATHISSTIEMLNFEVDVDVCVIDEVQMIDDRDRGWAWANAIIGAPAKEIIMTGSPNVKEAIIALAEYLGEELEIINFERKNPLRLLDEPTNVRDVKEATAIIAFTRKDVLKLKQNFSKHFKVSVVYGNLSPEVRREEARRFREKETQILIATDAIAMGMNLPIQTILFSKADKFDGISQRNLQPSEVHQISGRAGRFGLHEEGFVGALNSEVLSMVKKNFHKEAKKITVPFRVMANLEHIKLVSTILEERSLKEVLRFFVENMEFSGPFHASNLDDMVEAAIIVDRYDLDIATKYHLACAPLTLKSPYILSAFESYIVSLEQKMPVVYVPPILSGSFAQTAEELLQAEDMVKEISLYLWLSYRFKEYFLDAERARKSRHILNKFIEESLQQSHFVPRCRMCQAALPLNSKYSICQTCFKKHYTTQKGHRANHRR